MSAQMLAAAGNAEASKPISDSMKMLDSKAGQQPVNIIYKLNFYLIFTNLMFVFWIFTNFIFET